MSARSKEERRFIIVFLAPAFILFTTFVFLPAMRALLYSFQKWDGLGTPEWVGLANFVRLLRDDNIFLVALGHNLLLFGIAGGLTIALSLFFASLLSQKIRGASLFRIVFFFPNVIAMVAVALLWILLYSTTDFGVINALLGRVESAAVVVGLPLPDLDLPFPFLQSKYLIASIIPMIVWSATGFYMVLFLAGMGGIPKSYYEAARLEGATAWQQFWHITFPLLREILVVAVVFMMISLMKYFDPIWVMENEAPNRESHVLATLLYQKVFTEYDMGYASAVAVLLFLIVLGASAFSFAWSRKERIEY
ncbi:MAG: sugar ABC transporter permease [Candidatus Hydrogenedentes bacterium]|nr:sugar ABC transporter permease [Candidatus Hydrogenedentota bacterium]